MNAMQPLTRAEVEAIEDIHAATTKGKWELVEKSTKKGFPRIGIRANITDSWACLIAVMRFPLFRKTTGNGLDVGAGRANAEFMAAAHDDVPRLCATVKHFESLLKRGHALETNQYEIEDALAAWEATDEKAE